MLSLIERDEPDLVILEMENLQALGDVMAAGDLWSRLGDWHIMVASERRGKRSVCIYMGTPWEMHEIEDPPRKHFPTLQIGRVQI